MITKGKWEIHDTTFRKKHRTFVNDEDNSMLHDQLKQAIEKAE